MPKQNFFAFDSQCEHDLLQLQMAHAIRKATDPVLTPLPLRDDTNPVLVRSIKPAGVTVVDRVGYDLRSRRRHLPV